MRPAMVADKFEIGNLARIFLQSVLVISHIAYATANVTV